MKGLLKLLPIGVVVALLAVLAPAPVQAAGVPTDGVDGTVTAGNLAPQIVSVALQDSGGTPTTAMTPQTSFLLAIEVSDANTLDDISTIEVDVYYDTTVGAGSPPASWDSDSYAIYKWTKGGTPSEWTMETPAEVTETSWAVGTGVTPVDLGITQDTWKLAFTPGKLATEVATAADTDEWNFKVTVTDAGELSDSDQSEITNSMAAYAEISIGLDSPTTPGTIDFGTVNPGATAAIADPSDQNLTTQVLSNDQYELDVKSSATWTKETDSITLSGETTATADATFALTIDDAQTAETGHPATAEAVKSDYDGGIIGHTGDVAVTTDALANEVAATQDFYMDIILAPNKIPVGQYTGTLTFQVTNS